MSSDEYPGVRRGRQRKMKRRGWNPRAVWTVGNEAVAGMVWYVGIDLSDRLVWRRRWALSTDCTVGGVVAGKNYEITPTMNGNEIRWVDSVLQSFIFVYFLLSSSSSSLYDIVAMTIRRMALGHRSVQVGVGGPGEADQSIDYEDDLYDGCLPRDKSTSIYRAGARCT